MPQKKKYEPPLVYDLSGAASDGAYAQSCKSGHAAGAACSTGLDALNNCTTGRTALSRCGVGDNVVAAQNCQPGPTATGKRCETGGMAYQKCKAGGAK